MILMEKFQEERRLAFDKYRLAHHMLTQTYPLIKDNKLLVSVSENMYRAIVHSMSSLLHLERMLRLIPPFNDTFESKFNLFRTKLVSKYNIDLKYVRLINDISALRRSHKESSVEFSREGKFVMCDSDYKIKSISVDELKKYLSETEFFLNLTEKLLKKNERLY